MTDQPRDFIREIIVADLKAGRHQQVVTRFPPEPNGYLHIGHAKSIALNFGLAAEFKGVCHLRMDDTNPATEDIEYVEAICRDLRWLGFDWQDKQFFASDYFERLYAFAEELIRSGKAYVDSSSEAEIRELRGTISAPGKASAYRNRSAEENLDLFRRMRAGEFPDGAHVLRAKIDLTSPNMKMRDPLLYRIRHAHHYRRGSDWCVYPFYDFTHCLSDAIEGITHSICTLEFENNRELYDWVLDNLKVPSRPHQYEFARLSLTYTVMSKRAFLQLVKGKHVSGWDDPRMPTIAGLRRRGVTPEAIRALCERVGVAKHNSVVDVALFEHCIREDLSARSPRMMAVMDPLPVLIENYPEGPGEKLEAGLWPHDVPKEGSRALPFAREILIEREDFAELPPKGWHRLSPGAEVRLRHAYVIRCERVERDDSGRVQRLICSYDASSRGGETTRKIKGTLHWVSAAHAADVEVRLYDRLFGAEAPGKDSGDPLADLNRDSLRVVTAKAEPEVAQLAAGSHVQLERIGYFFAEPEDSRPGAPVLNRVVALKDTWAKVARRPDAAAPAKPKAKPKAAPPAARAALDADAQALVERHDLSPEDARVLSENVPLKGLFEQALRTHDNARTIASWLVNELPKSFREADESSSFDATRLGELVARIDDQTISTAAAKKVFEQLLAGNEAVDAIIDRLGLRQIADEGDLAPLVERVLAENSDAVERYRAGNKNLLGAFVGMVMRESRGRANPALANKILRQKLG